MSTVRTAARAWRSIGALGALVLGLQAGWADAAPADLWVVDDAERFAALFARGPADAAALQLDYLQPGSPGITIFTPHRIQNATNLARAVAAQRADYERAIRLCLPVARGLRQEVGDILARVGQVLGQDRAAPAYLVFGAGNSGGTAGPAGLVLGLEVICQQADTPAAVAQVLKDFVAHEMVHVYQERAGAMAGPGSLLKQALIEGFADHVMHQVLGGQTLADAARSRYGLAHEARLWQAFRADVVAGRERTNWLYRQDMGASGQPPDMGYWIGKRICEAYLARATDKAAALRTLLQMRDPEAVLAASGYAPAGQ